jgi:hypothetical protein
VEKLREAGCEDREIEAITGMSPAMITRYSRFANQRQLAKTAAERLERRTASERLEMNRSGTDCKNLGKTVKPIS